MMTELRGRLKELVRLDLVGVVSSSSFRSFPLPLPADDVGVDSPLFLRSDTPLRSGRSRTFSDLAARTPFWKVLMSHWPALAQSLMSTGVLRLYRRL